MTKDAENNVSIMENGYIGCSHRRPANKDNPSQTEVGSKTLLMVSHPYERTEVAGGKTSVKMDGKGSSSGSIGVLDGKLDSTSRNLASVSKLGVKARGQLSVLLLVSAFISLLFYLSFNKNTQASPPFL